MADVFSASSDQEANVSQLGEIAKALDLILSMKAAGAGSTMDTSLAQNNQQRADIITRARNLADSTPPVPQINQSNYSMAAQDRLDAANAQIADSERASIMRIMRAFMGTQNGR